MEKQEGLLFRLSGQQGSCPETAGGDPVPNFFKDIEIIDSGVKGKALRCLPTQLLAYWAPGNIYSQQGTVAFFWRSRTPLGETEFPLFRVSFADHSSWDALFMRIDYNGGGIDAFVTDINLSRLRISHKFETLPSPKQWFHIAFTWDETVGVRLYIDGKKAGSIDGTALLYAGLDQFGTHSRIISNAQVQSSYNYMRTGDFDEIRIYDRMLDEKQVEALSRAEEPALSPLPERDLKDRVQNDRWQRRYGFDAEVIPAPISHRYTKVRKVEIHDAWDQKRWWWKGCDGIRETTWPGVYNRSGLPGRCDYFVLPDWDCYSVSGKEITFIPLADEYFNQVEISGSAEGTLRIHGRMEEQYEGRRLSCERSVLRLPEPVRNVEVTFTNDVIEEPIGDITLLLVEPGCCPKEARKERFYLSGRPAESEAKKDAFLEAEKFLKGRYMEDERQTFYGTLEEPKEAAAEDPGKSLPVCHMLLPYRQQEDEAMDGLVFHLPALSAAITHGDYILVNIQVKDPLWIYRNLIQFTFAVRPGQEKDIWLDMRDRILPDGGILYVSAAFSAKVSQGEMASSWAEVVYKDREEGKKEHIADRWIQVKDNYANLVEENPSNEHFNLFNRFKRDIMDLLTVCPEHRLAQEYWYDKFKTNKPEFRLSPCPEGVPEWAWRQTEYMGYVKRYIRWWIDKRQIENGEFGGGLSDDGDLTAWWPGPAMTGCMPEKIKNSLATELEAFYDQGMFSNGLCAIQTDQLHTLEEGIQCLGQCLTLMPDSPKYLERAMENARGLHYVTGYNAKGHRHMLSGYYSGTRIALEQPWHYSASDSFHVLHPTYMLARYNGSPKAKKLVLEMADAMMDHYYDGRLHVQIDIETDEDQVHERTREWPLFYAAWQFTGDRKYLQPIADGLYERQQDTWKSLGELEEKTKIAYEKLLEQAALREYINTDGQLWVDRGVIDIAQIQKDRIGGVAHERFSLYPRHFIRWEFAPGEETDVAVLVTKGAPDQICFSAYNMTDKTATAKMTFEDVLPGIWEMKQGCGRMLGESKDTVVSKVEGRRFDSVLIVFEPGCYTTVELTLSEPGIPYWEQPDLAIEKEDVIVKDSCIRVMVHNIGGRDSVLTTLALKDPNGNVLRSSQIPPIPAPSDLYPKAMEIPLWTRGINLEGCFIELDPEQRMNEITRNNNIVWL